MACLAIRKLGTNRGVAILRDKVFFVTDNAHLLALDRATGKLLWDTPMAPDGAQPYGGTVAPLIVNDTVIAGVAGGDHGIRGFVAAFKPDTGALVWRRWTVPAAANPASKPGRAKNRRRRRFHLAHRLLRPLIRHALLAHRQSLARQRRSRSPRRQPLHQLRSRAQPEDRRDQVALPVHAARPEGSRRHRAERAGRRLYKGKPSKLLLHADRNGFFYVLDRTDGKVLLAKPFLRRVDWATSIGPDGRPVVIDPRGCPSDAANWDSTAYSPRTGLYYFMALEECTGKPTSYPDQTGQRFLRALNIETGEIAWEVPQPGPPAPRPGPAFSPRPEA